MVFSSPTFLFLFFPVVFLLHAVLPRRFRNALLLGASLIFYGWGEPLFVLVMILSALVNYLFSNNIDRRYQDGKPQRVSLALAISFNIGLLSILKYADFILSSINSLFATHLPLPGIPLPIGISFFTFQAMSYVIDVYRRHTPAQKSYGNLLLYISFFPQLIAGPIVRYHDIAEQIHRRSVTAEKTADGLTRFAIGLAKKVLIANYAGQIADQVYGLANNDLTLSVGWLGAIAYLIQIYFDFSGYSDMAIGLGRIFGFEFKENFLYPYAAHSIKDFWHRWHISLSTWFKEYVYIPLGGNRRGRLRTAINKVIVFFLTGLWHGASWTFVIWGLIHGLFLLIEDFVKLPFKRILRPVRHVYTLLVVLLTFVLFRSETFRQAQAMLRAMFSGLSSTAGSPAESLLASLLTPATWVILPLSMILSLPVWPAVKRHLSNRMAAVPLGILRFAGSIVIFAACLLSLSTSAYNPFIYFRF